MLGSIADDVTGAVDLASNLVSRGFRTRVHFGVPASPLDSSDTDAFVIALTTRTATVARALADSAASLDALRAAGAERFYVKYCSTFDSTPRGNIGPICDLAAERTGSAITVIVPSFPANGRTVYRGHLFVDDVPLSESSMARHPLTPMTDSNIVRVMQQQTDQPVALLPLPTVRSGADAVSTALATLSARGVRYAVVDAVDDGDLAVIAAATAGAPLVTGGSGLALGLSGPAPRAAMPAPEEVRQGPRVVLVGSASEMTRRQLQRAADAGLPVVRLDVSALESSSEAALEVVSAISVADSDALVVIAPADSPDGVDGTTPEGKARATALERTFGALARRLVDEGVRRFLVAGGETSGAVAEALGVADLVLGETIDPGVAWTFARAVTVEGDVPLALALKSGNFGGRDFFLDAWRRLL